MASAAHSRKYRERQRADQKVLLVSVSNASMLAQMFIEIGWLKQDREDDTRALVQCVERLIEIDLDRFIQERSQ